MEKTKFCQKLKKKDKIMYIYHITNKHLEYNKTKIE